MRLPLLLAALTAGIGTAPLLPQSSFLLLAPLPVGLIGLSALCRKWRSWPAAITFFFFLTGLSLYHLLLTPSFDSSHIKAFAGSTEISIEGRIEEITKHASGKTVIDLATARIASRKIAVNTHGRLRLYINNGDVPLLPGDHIRFLSRIRIPRRYGTPGEFDMPRHLASKGIYATAFVKDASALAKIISHQPTSNIVGRWRTRIEVIIEESVAPSAAPLVKALTIGKQNEITQNTRELMAAGGISHLFAISGLHLGMVALFLYVLARSVYRRSALLLGKGPPKRYLPVVLLPFLWVYLLLSGEAVSTQRAFLMACGGAILLLSSRRSSPLHLLCSAAFLLLLANPLLLFEPAFQLSFSAVAGIVILLPRWSPLLSCRPPFIHKTGMLILTTSAATITTMPVVLYHFHHIPTSTLLCNLLSIPLVGLFALPAGLAGSLIAPLSPVVAGIFFQGCGLTLDVILTVTKTITELPGFSGIVLYPSTTKLFALVLLVLTVLAPTHTCLYRKIRLSICAMAILIFFFPHVPESSLRITALSVGQGDAILLSLDEEKHYLIDGGGLFSDTFDVGERLVAPALGRLGISTLKGVILTHSHPDHWKGLPYILKNFDVEAFWTNLPDDQVPDQLQNILRQKHIPSRRLSEGWSPVDSASSSVVEIFAPETEEDSDNDQSLTLYAHLGNEGALLTGDLETTGVEELLASSRPKAVTLLKIPHHGSRKSAPGRLLDSFSPRLLFVSLGKDNPYNFPHKEVVHITRERNIPLFRTDILGTLTFSTKGEGWQVDSYAAGVLH